MSENEISILQFALSQMSLEERELLFQSCITVSSKIGNLIQIIEDKNK